MNQNPSDDSANVGSTGRSVVASTTDLDRSDSRSERLRQRPSQHLNPLIHQALGSLDLQLEDELNRFRTHQADPSPVATTAAPVEVVWEQSADLDDSEILTAEIVKSAIAYHSADSSPAKATAGFAVVDGLASFTSADGRPATINYGKLATRSESGDNSDRENLNLNFSAGGQIATVTADEYSSASQELLRQIQAGYRTQAAQSKATPAKSKRHLSPLKIGSAAAVCAIAGGATYAYFNPSVLAPLMATKTVTPLVATTTSSLGTAIESPNLAANEFTDLTLSRINTLKLPTATATVNTAPAPTIAAPTGVPTAPVAVPYNPMTTAVVPPTATITSQPQLADSLVRTLLPANYQTGVRPIAPTAAPRPAVRPAAKSPAKS